MPSKRTLFTKMACYKMNKNSKVFLKKKKKNAFTHTFSKLGKIFDQLKYYTHMFLIRSDCGRWMEITGDQKLCSIVVFLIQLLSGVPTGKA